MIEFSLDRMDIFMLFILWFTFKFFEAFFKAFHDTRKERKAMEKLMETTKARPQDGNGPTT